MSKVTIITIGDEILSGHTLDTNSVYIGQRLAELGHSVRFRYTVGDSAQDIATILREALKSDTDIIITTGGLGPTKDDITKQTIADVLGRRLIWRADIMGMVKEYFVRQAIEMPKINMSQGYIPEGATPLANPVGTAPGILIEESKKLIFILPGVPREMKSIFENEVVPLLKERLPSRPPITVTFHTTGIPESRIQELIGDIEDIAFLPHHIGVDLSVSRKTKKEIEEIRKFLKHRLGKTIYGEDDDTLGVVVGRLLKDNHLTIGVAESLTGGLAMHRITNVSGSSEYFLGGVVAYANELKKEILGIKEETLKRYGAVSKETAVEMAMGIREATGADIGASTTGIAGPTGGTREKPIGLVYTAVYGENGARCEKNLFKGDRSMIKEMSAQKLLDTVRIYILS